MVIVYDLETKEIKYTEEHKMEPAIPPGSAADKIKSLADRGLGFISIPYELGADATNYTLNFDDKGRFIGLQPNPLENPL